MATDAKTQSVNVGDIVTVQLIVREVNAGQAGDNIRCNPYLKGDTSGSLKDYWINSSQVVKQ